MWGFFSAFLFAWDFDAPNLLLLASRRLQEACGTRWRHPRLEGAPDGTPVPGTVSSLARFSGLFLFCVFIESVQNTTSISGPGGSADDERCCHPAALKANAAQMHCNKASNPSRALFQ